MIALYTVLSLLALFVITVLVRTLIFKPFELPPVKAEPVHVNIEKATEDLAQMIRCRTVSNIDPALEDDNEFVKFEETLKKLFPKLHEKCTLEKPSKRALLYKWEGREHIAPAVLMAHYDVVSAEEDKWEKPAFSGILENGILWGRGALDTKCTLNGILQAAEQLISSGFVPKSDIYFAFGGNEETNGDGAPSIVSLFKERGINPAFVLDEGGAVVNDVFPGVSEPAALVGIAEKGILNIEYSVSSGGGHSSSPLPSTPVGKLSRACVRLESKPFSFRLTPPAKMLFNSLARHSSFFYRMLFANLWCFSPILNTVSARSGGQMNALLRTTVAFTQMEGSKGVNVIPPKARMVSNLRLLPGDTIESAVTRVKKTIKDKDIEVKVINGTNPSRISLVQTNVYKNLETVIRESFDGVLVSPYLMIACSDSRHFSEISDKVYRFSPFTLTKEENATVHGNNERIPVGTIAKIAEFYVRLISTL